MWSSNKTKDLCSIRSRRVKQKFPPAVKRRAVVRMARRMSPQRSERIFRRYECVNEFESGTFPSFEAQLSKLGAISGRRIPLLASLRGGEFALLKMKPSQPHILSRPRWTRL